MNEYEKRKQAIIRYQNGEKVTQIVKALGKSRRWFYNWLKRYQLDEGKGDWFEDHSRAPRTISKKIAPSVEQQVIDARKKLERKRIAQTGAIAIQYELHQQGLEAPPVWTINRILARNGLIRKKEPVYRSGKDYPELIFHTHQMDLVGPRWLKGAERFYSVNILDTCSHSCYFKLIRSKSSLHIAEVLSEFWQTHGLPDALQMDNELAFRGSNRYPHSFGIVVRFALALGIAPVFIPIKEPWRNGMIEKFNHTWDKRFFRAQQFDSFDHLQRASKEFISFHNANHRYSSQAHQTPDQLKAQLLAPILYDASINLNQKIPLTEGSIYYIRFIRSDLKLHLPTESFPVPSELKYSYVVAEVNIDVQALIIRRDNQVVLTMPYLTPVDW